MIVSKRIKFYHLLSLLIVLFLVNLAVDAAAYETKSNKQNRVRVDVRPVQLEPGKPARFEVRMNTHSEELSQDMLAVVTLKDNKGREYQATNWVGSPPGGHHLSGVLEFPELDGNPESITLVIRLIADGPDRTFKWSVKR
jgi:hypothetical protein